MRDVSIRAVSHEIVDIPDRHDTIPTRSQAQGMVADMYIYSGDDPRDPHEWRNSLASALDFIVHDWSCKRRELAIVRHFVAEGEEEAARVAASHDPSRDPALVALMRATANEYVLDNIREIGRDDLDYVECTVVDVVSSPRCDTITRHLCLASVDITALFDEEGAQ